MALIGEIAIHGFVSEGFEPVREAFERNFSENGDKGASVAVYVGGEPKVDLWGGVADVATGRAWQEDTIAVVYSATKGAAAILCHLLTERGLLDLDAPICQYWPEFAANGKEQITTRQVLSHTAGLPLVDAALTRQQVLDGSAVVEALAAQNPLWTPGTEHGYHALTYGWLIGEIVRRVTGRSLGENFATEIAKPLDLDFFIGLPEKKEGRVAPLIDPPPLDPAALDAIEDEEVKALYAHVAAAMADPTSLFFRAGTTNGALPAPSAEVWNSRDVHAAEQAAAGGITNARSLARLYAACVSDLAGTRLLSEATLHAATRELACGPDKVLVQRTRVASGFVLPSMSLPKLSDESFGHAGAGGALGLGDPTHRVGVGYVPNAGAPGGARAELLVAALRECL
jgi:CubicO group peptidase (beta-lactamase class C family)